MKRIVLAVVAVAALAALAVSWATAGAARTSGTAAAKVRICHRTSSKARPYARLSVTRKALRTHLRHAADIYPVPRRGCPRTVLTPASGGTAFTVAMTGESESPAGDPVGTGTATIRMRAGQAQVCFRFDVQNIGLPAAGAHIHRGAAGTAGSIVVPLTAPGSQGTASGCARAARGTVASILRGPAGFYVNVHTTDFPGGAVRGQLRGTSADSLGTVFVRPLAGANERPPADPDGSGTAVVRLRPDAGAVCYRLSVQNILLPAAGAHIHRGAAGANGPIVVQFTAPGASGVSAGCTTGVAASLIQDIAANPAGFYVNVHTKEYPGGAIRAQLG
jgi:CHRD domain